MLKLAIDFGTAVTKIFKLGQGGIVLSEATCVTVSKETGEIRAFGDEAKRLLGKTAELTEVRFPVYEGEIVDEKLAAALLEYFLEKIARRGRIEALFCVPCGCGSESRAKYLRVASAAGISRVRFVETPYLVALGSDCPLSDANPVFALDIGAGKASAAAFSLDGIIAGFTMNVGGNNIDVRIIDHIAETFDLKIGSLSAERLKNKIGIFIKYDVQVDVTNGRDIATGKPRSVSISSEDILLPIRQYTDKILEYAEVMLRKLPAEVSAAMCKSGVYLAGGVTALAGFDKYASERLQMEAHPAADALMTIVLGGGRAIGNGALLRRIEML